MFRVAILDDYQEAALRLADWPSLHPQAQITSINTHIADGEALARRLHDCDAVVAMRERTPFNRKVIDEFRANEGRVGGYFEGRSLALVHHRGVKSGVERVNPLAYQRIDDNSGAIFASAGGAPKHPDWYYNLKARPDVRIEVGADTIDVVATEATGEERERLFRTQAERVPQFAEYEKQADRVIPVIVLTPAESG